MAVFLQKMDALRIPLRIVTHLLRIFRLSVTAQLCQLL